MTTLTLLATAILLEVETTMIAAVKVQVAKRIEATTQNKAAVQVTAAVELEVEKEMLAMIKVQAAKRIEARKYVKAAVQVTAIGKIKTTTSLTGAVSVKSKKSTCSDQTNVNNINKSKR